MTSYVPRVVVPVTLLVLCSVGCAKVTGGPAAGSDLQSVRSFYVVRDKQSDATDAVQKELARRGFTATSGPEANMPSDAQCKVLVQDHWMWDITMYLLEMKVDLTHPRTGASFASGTSYRPSLQRKSPEEMAREVFDRIYGTTPEKK